MLVTATWTGAASTSSRPAAKPTQGLAVLLGSQQVRSKPDARSKPLRLVQSRRPLTGVRTVLPVLGRWKDRQGRRWLRVRLPGRPNGSTGWIRRRGTFPIRSSWHLVIDTSSRQVTAYKHGRRIRVFKAIVGAASTPTPHGSFFIEESIKLSPRAVGAPLALALSARSNVLQEFAGGPGQIGLHGLRNVGGTLGTAVSHGCVRLDTGAMRWLVARVTPGVTVSIKG